MLDPKHHDAEQNRQQHRCRTPVHCFKSIESAPALGVQLVKATRVFRMHLALRVYKATFHFGLSSAHFIKALPRLVAIGCAFQFVCFEERARREHHLSLEPEHGRDPGALRAADFEHFAEKLRGDRQATRAAHRRLDRAFGLDRRQKPYLGRG
jgi:hypothetical protein